MCKHSPQLLIQCPAVISGALRDQQKHQATYSEKDKAFEWLEKAYEERNMSLIFLNVEPEMEGLRSDPRFVHLLRRVGIAQK